MYDYEEVCPISRAASVLCERWTLQIIREMLFGATRFSEFQKYLPKMSPTLLNTRLRTLEQQGIIFRKRIPEKKGFEYHLTPSGKALKPLLEEFGKWGIRWVFEAMDPQQLNLSTIIRDYAVALRTDELPAGDVTIQFNVTGREQPQKKFILVRDGQPQVCEDNIGHEVDVYLTADLETLGKIWFGELRLSQAVDQGVLKAVGAPVYTRHLSRWLGVSELAGEERETGRAFLTPE